MVGYEKPDPTIYAIYSIRLCRYMPIAFLSLAFSAAVSGNVLIQLSMSLFVNFLVVFLPLFIYCVFIHIAVVSAVSYNDAVVPVLFDEVGDDEDEELEEFVDEVDELDAVEEFDVLDLFEVLDELDEAAVCACFFSSSRYFKA